MTGGVYKFQDQGCERSQVNRTSSALTLQDANGAGPGTLNLVSNASVGGGLHTITTLTDGLLSNLNISGTGSVTITNMASVANVLSIANNNTSTAATTIGTLTATGGALGTLNYSGTHAATISTLVDEATNITLTNANTGTSAPTPPVGLSWSCKTSLTNRPTVCWHRSADT